MRRLRWAATLAFLGTTVLASCGADKRAPAASPDDGGAGPVDGAPATRDGAVDPGHPDGGAPPIDGGPCALDRTAPILTCSGTATLVRASAATAAAAPVVSALDACDGPVDAVADPAALDRGLASITYRAFDSAGNAASCTTAATVLDAFAVEGLRIVHAERVAGGATSVTLAWEPSAGEDATGYRVERAPSADGPWEPAGLVAASVPLWVEATVPEDGRFYRVVTLANELDGGASPALQVHAVSADGYHLRDQPVATVRFATSLYGVVRYPADLARGPFPLELLLHGNHGNCRGPDPTQDDECAELVGHECTEPGYGTAPNAEGLAYLAETLAAHGFVAVSISANALNCREDFIFERTYLLLAHLRWWHTWATVGAEPFGSMFAGAVDLSRVGLVGHSRGGEAVAHAPRVLVGSPVEGVRLAGIFAIGPTDYHEALPSDVPYAVLLPGCDGDVQDLAGMHVYDRASASAGAAARAQVLFAGANHNFFSTEWRFDDNVRDAACPRSAEVGAVVQQRMLEAVLGSWMEAVLLGRVPEAFVRADAATPAGVGAWVGAPLDLRWSYSAADRSTVTDFEEAGAPGTNRLGPNVFRDFGTAELCRRAECGIAFAHARSGVLLGWDVPAPEASFGLGGVDASSYAALSFRMVSRRSRRNVGLTEQDFLVRLRDADGTVVELPLSSVRPVPHLYPATQVYEVLQTVRLPLGALAATSPDLDLGALAALELSMSLSGHESGSIVVSDVELAR